MKTNREAYSEGKRLATVEDVSAAQAGKQDKLIAGNGINIEGSVISATGEVEPIDYNSIQGLFE